MSTPDVGRTGLRWYGAWSGNERGTPENTERCVEEVQPRYTYIPKQCSRQRTDGLYCTQHAQGYA